jgi:hypothetical protein
MIYYKLDINEQAWLETNPVLNGFVWTVEDNSVVTHTTESLVEEYETYFADNNISYTKETR